MVSLKLPGKNALLLSGYSALSQKNWCDSLVQATTDIQWKTLELPPRYFSWRMRGAPLSFKALEPSIVNDSFDFIVATSSVDLATTQSLYGNLRNLPSLLYFHENQFDYPKSNRPQSVVDWQMVSLYSALRADTVAFNSSYNRNSFLLGLSELLRKLPDLVPSGIVEGIEEKSFILPVPIARPAPPSEARQTKHDSLKILWNHRWEWDKNPKGLLAFIECLKEKKINFELYITGQEFRKTPEEFIALKENHSDVIAHIGYIKSREAYSGILNKCHIVLSTALHEFQGVAVQEAVAHGCVPLLPDRLSYPEFFSENYLYEPSENVKTEANNAAEVIERWLKLGTPTSPNISDLYPENVLPKYLKLFDNLCDK